MPYKITIEKIETVATTERGPWQVIDRVPWTDAELLERSSRAYGTDAKELIEREPLREVRGYAPERDITKTETVQVFQQVVDDLNLKAVIGAINS